MTGAATVMAVAAAYQGVEDYDPEILKVVTASAAAAEQNYYQLDLRQEGVGQA